MSTEKNKMFELWMILKCPELIVSDARRIKCSSPYVNRDFPSWKTQGKWFTSTNNLSCFFQSFLWLVILIKNSGSCKSGAPLLSKFGKLSMREKLVLTSAYVRLYWLWERVRIVPRQPDGGRRMSSFLGLRNCEVPLGNQCSKAIVREKLSSIYMWREKVQNNTELSLWWKAEC